MRIVSSDLRADPRWFALPLLLTLAACSQGAAGKREAAAVADTATAAGDSVVRTLTVASGYLDSLQTAADGGSVSAVIAADTMALTPRESAAQPAAVRGASAGTLSFANDTVRGYVTVVGSAPATHVVLTSFPSHSIITLSGMGADGLRPLAGLDVMVRGTKVSERDVVVTGFEVRRADGNEAWDGQLEQTDAGYQLRLTDGSGVKRLAQVPAGLRDAIGSRVWIALKSGTTAAQAFGLIEKR